MAEPSSLQICFFPCHRDNATVVTLDSEETAIISYSQLRSGMVQPSRKLHSSGHSAFPSQQKRLKGKKAGTHKPPEWHSHRWLHIFSTNEVQWKQAHRQKPRHKQPMPHPQKFQHSTCVLIHQLAPLVVHVLGLSDRRCELSSWGWARHPFFHEQ